MDRSHTSPKTIFSVASTRCIQCLFTANRIVRPGRVPDVLQQCLDTDRFFICHKATMAGLQVCCKGFYDSTYGDRVTPVQLAKRLTAMFPDLYQVELIDVDRLDQGKE